MMTARFEKRELKKLFLYADVAVIGLFAISLIMLVRDAYIAGFWEDRDLVAQSQQYWYMMRDVVFLVASLAWIFVRYFKDKIIALENPWVG